MCAKLDLSASVLHLIIASSLQQSKLISIWRSFYFALNFCCDFRCFAVICCVFWWFPVFIMRFIDIYSVDREYSSSSCRLSYCLSLVYFFRVHDFDYLSASWTMTFCCEKWRFTVRSVVVLFRGMVVFCVAVGSFVLDCG